MCLCVTLNEAVVPCRSSRSKKSSAEQFVRVPGGLNGGTCCFLGSTCKFRLPQASLGASKMLTEARPPADLFSDSASSSPRLEGSSEVGRSVQSFEP
jgi:hypothetical protein